MNMHMQTPVENMKIRLASIGRMAVKTKPPVGMDNGLSADDLKIQYAVSVIVNRPESCVDITVSMAYSLEMMDAFSGSLTSRFDVIDLERYIVATEGSNEFQIQNDFLPMLINIAFGTTRGYLARELQDTVLSPYPFPMISMDNIQKRTSYRLI